MKTTQQQHIHARQTNETTNSNTPHHKQNIHTNNKKDKTVTAQRTQSKPMKSINQQQRHAIT